MHGRRINIPGTHRCGGNHGNCGFFGEAGGRPCCNACGRNEGHHTRNCAQEPYTPAVPAQPIWQPFHGEAHRLDEASAPDDHGNDSGMVDASIGPARGVGPNNCYTALVRLAREPIQASDVDMIADLAWYFDHYNTTWSDALLGEWALCLRLCNFHASHIPVRDFELHVFGKQFQDRTLDVPSVFIIDATSCNAHARERYNHSDVTGHNLEVQAVVASHVSCPLTIMKAVCTIESHPYENKFGICCAYGKHRSPAIAFLLKRYAYQNARLIFHHPLLRKYSDVL